MQFSHTVQVVIIGQDRTLELACQNDEFVVDFAHPLHVNVTDAGQDVGLFLQFSQDFHAPASALAAQPVRGISDILQFVQHEARDE